MELAMNLVAIYIAQIGICAIINVINSTRVPKDFSEFLGMTFLPILLLRLGKYRNK
jgi:rRNA pseudouridine-1189 N-methylase Emg1 (Nep1/Mra1 family)